MRSNIGRRSLVLGGVASVAAMAWPSRAEASQYEELDLLVDQMRLGKRFLTRTIPNEGFAGHRKEAVEALDLAIKKLQAALKYANKEGAEAL
jgi:hypothetical protein